MTELRKQLYEKWQVARPIIERSVKYGKYTIEQIDEKVLGLQWALWMGDNSAILTEQWDNDFGPVMTICYAAGDMDEVLKMYDTIEHAARCMGCIKIYILGRPGWKRVMEGRGYSDENMISKELR